MTEHVKTQKTLGAFILEVEQTLDQVVNQGSDQQLFIASYLQGHFAVAAGQSQVEHMTEIQQLAGLMELSLKQAFEKNELIAEDQRQVLALWQHLLTQ